MAKIYDFKAQTSKGKEIDFSQFQGKVLLDASASFRRIKTLLLYNLILFAECYYGIIGTVTEVVINHAITCWNCY